MSVASNYSMTIELRSDMCCGTGEVSGVAVDQLTALDDYGLPVIPAKRLKGLLREQAALIELPKQRGLTDALLGVSGAELSGKLSFGDARLVGHQQIKAIANRDGLTPGTVAAVYTTTRTGTSVEEDGVAADHTLHTIQLVRHCSTSGTPTRFACVVRGIDLSREEKKFFNDVVHCLRAIGLKKSRGLGEVVCGGAWSDLPEPQGTGQAALASADESGTMRMGYRIALDEPAVIQGVGSNLDYIPGAAVQGIFASLFRDDADVLSCVLNDARFSNAYVEAGSNETLSTTPVPFTYQGAKNDMGASDGATGKLLYRLYDAALSLDVPVQDGGVQRVGLSGFGVSANGSYQVVKVEQSMSFHSSSDSSPQGKQYYSICSIDAGQSFSGTIEVPSAVAQRLEEAVLARGASLRVGAAGSAGFGKCCMELFRAPEPGTLQLKPGDRVAIRLVSDVVYVDERGSNSVDVAAFVRSLSRSGVLGFEFDPSMDASADGMPCRAFVRTCVVGGYNAHWRLPKRQYVALQKGSVVVATVVSCPESAVSSEAWTGLLQQEGCGQLEIAKLDATAFPDSYVKVRPAAFAGDARRESGDVQAVESFEHDLAYNEALERAELAACELGDAYPLGAVSKSSFMRISSVFSSVQKTVPAGDALHAFRSLAADVLADDEQLNGQCAKLADRGEGLLREYPRLNAACKDAVFAQIVRGFLHQVKVRYSTQKGGFHD